MNQTATGMLLLVIVTGLVLIIFACLYYLWLKTKKLEVLARNSRPIQALEGRADICGYAGKKLYEVLQAKNEGEHRPALSIQSEVAQVYAFGF